MPTETIPTGNVLPTPEAGPLTPPTMREHYVTSDTATTPEGTAALAGPAAAATPAARTTPAGKATPAASTTPAAKGAPSLEDAAHDLGERLKPVVAAAEDVAAKALDLSAKGLSKLVDALEERRKDRDNASS